METMAHWQQVSLSLPRCSYLVTQETSHASTNRAQIVLNSSSSKCTPNDIYQGAPGREKRSNEQASRGSASN